MEGGMGTRVGQEDLSWESLGVGEGVGESVKAIVPVGFPVGRKEEIVMEWA